MLLKKRTKGYISISNGKIDITDPCYKKGEWCQITDLLIKQGEYKCRYYMGAELELADITEITELAKEFGDDVEEAIKRKQQDIRHRCFAIELQLKNRAFQLNSPKWKKIGSIGVDSGMAGFFWNKPDFSDEQWIHFCDNINFDKTVWLDKDMGFWSLSGYGDGGYDVYAIKENKEIIALKICF